MLPFQYNDGVDIVVLFYVIRLPIISAVFQLLIIDINFAYHSQVQKKNLRDRQFQLHILDTYLFHAELQYT